MSAFKPGQSGNPKGRKPGPSKIGKLRATLETGVPAILSALVDAAKTGDPVAAKIILDRVLPPLRPETRQSTPTPVDPDGILTAVATGQIGLDQATGLMALAATRVKIAEGEEMVARLTAMESMLSTLSAQGRMP